MLDTTIEALRSEIQEAKKIRGQRLARWGEMIAEYHGPSYDGGVGTGEYLEENTGFEVIASVNPQIVFANPRFRLTSRRPEYQRLRTQGLELAGHRWIRDTDPRALYEEVLTDFQFAAGVIYTRPAPYKLKTKRPTTADYDDPLHRPSSERVSPMEFVFDPVCKSPRTARWMGHPVTKDQDDWIEQAQDENRAAVDRGEEPPWSVDALRGLQPNEGDEELADGGGNQQGKQFRKSVTLYYLWVPEEELEDSPGSEKGFNGTWHVVPMTGKDDIRDAEPAFVPRWGPYTFIGAYRVPDQAYPLSLLTASDGVNQSLNREAKANVRAAERRKTLLVVDGTADDLPEQVAAAPDGSTVVADVVGVRDGVMEVELGGVTKEGLAAEEVTRNRRNRMVGLSEARQGQPAAGVTATADLIAQQGANVKVSHLQQKFQLDGVREHLRTVLWYLDMDSRYVAYLGDPGREIMGTEEPVYIGGLYPENEKRAKLEFPDEEIEFSDEDKEYTADDFDLLEIDIEPYSMMRSDDPVLMARAMQGFQIASQVIPLAERYPQGRWKMLLNQMGDAMNWPDFGNILDEEVNAVMQQLVLGQMVKQPQPEVRGRTEADVTPPAGIGSTSARQPFAAATKGGAF